MCGIAGVLYADAARPATPGVLEAMSAAIAHRGPDAEGFFTDPGIGLVHRRLSIIDLGGGDQPIGNEDGSIQVVFNGEIYNYLDLRAGLEANGHRFKTSSDTEVLVHLYEELGDRLVERLRGMYTFALWDRTRRRLLLARDRVGIKPLYVYRDHEKLIFGSEIKAILAHPGVERALDLSALETFLAYGMVTGPQSIFRKTERLPPAHTLAATHDDLRQAPRHYWRLRIEPDEGLSAEEWQEAIRAKLAETVKLHLQADVPVGALLSGGVDSSVIVAQSAGLVTGDLRTFSIGFSDGGVSELPYARQVADLYRTVHEEEIVTPDAVGLVDELTHYYDEPFADSSAVPTFLVSRLASRHVKVVLSGDGGDEAFGGYSRYAHDLREAAVRAWLPGWFRKHGLGLLGRVWPKADWLPRPLRLKTLLTNLSLDPAAAYANTLATCRLPLRRRLLEPSLAAAMNGRNPEDHIRTAYATAPTGDPLGGMTAADIATVLPDDFLVKTDRASMAHGLELRPPLLDHEFLELSARVPSRFKVRGGQTKWIFKEASRGILPKNTLTRKKQGFEMPIDAWLRGPLRPVFHDLVLAGDSAASSWINTAEARRLFDRHTSGMGRHGSVLWSLLVLARWTEKYRPAR